MKALITFLLVLLPALAFAGKPQGKLLFESFKYDFSTSTATSATPHSFDSFPIGAVIKNVYITVSEPVSPSAMAIAVGNDDDADGYLGAFTGSNTASGTPASAASAEAVLLWDNANDHLIPYRISTSDQAVFEIEFDDDPTQGKFEVFVEYFIPEVDPNE